MLTEKQAKYKKRDRMMQFLRFWNRNIQGIFVIYQLHVRNSKVRKKKCTLTQSEIFYFLFLELATRKQKDKGLAIELVT